MPGESKIEWTTATWNCGFPLLEVWERSERARDPEPHQLVFLQLLFPEHGPWAEVVEPVADFETTAEELTE